jgi:hypothetical protein
MRVDEGPRRIVRATILGGLEVTDPDLVTGRLRLTPGEPLSQSRLVETQRRLYDLGIFARADTAIQNADGEERRKYVLHQFEEARRHSVNFGRGRSPDRGGENGSQPRRLDRFRPRFGGRHRLNMFGLGPQPASGRVGDAPAGRAELPGAPEREGVLSRPVSTSQGHQHLFQHALGRVHDV